MRWRAVWCVSREASSRRARGWRSAWTAPAPILAPSSRSGRGTGDRRRLPSVLYRRPNAARLPLTHNGSGYLLTTETIDSLPRPYIADRPTTLLARVAAPASDLSRCAGVVLIAGLDPLRARAGLRNRWRRRQPRSLRLLERQITLHRWQVIDKRIAGRCVAPSGADSRAALAPPSRPRSKAPRRAPKGLRRLLGCGRQFADEAGFELLGLVRPSSPPVLSCDRSAVRVTSRPLRRPHASLALSGRGVAAVLRLGTAWRSSCSADDAAGRRFRRVRRPASAARRARRGQGRRMIWWFSDRFEA